MVAAEAEYPALGAGGGDVHLEDMAKARKSGGQSVVGQVAWKVCDVE